MWSYVVALPDGDHSNAQHGVQETPLRASRDRARPDRPPAPGGRLFTVANRIVIADRQAACRRPAVITYHVPEHSVDDMTQQPVDRQLVLSAMRTLSIEHRQVLIECYYRGASVAEAAETLGVPASTVKSRTYYALHALRQGIAAAQPLA
jgi:RNA polymerase sigma-70 factor (ECF subfamily)